jgi:hypothetical protein
LTRLKDSGEEEQKKLTEALDKVRPKAAFYRKTGEAAILLAPKSFHAKWQSPECALEVSFDGMAVTMVGTYDSPPNALAGIIAGGFMQPQPVRNKIEYIGDLRGQAIFGTVSRTRNEPQSAVVELAGNKVKVLMYFSADQSHLHVMENARSASPRFYELQKVA